MLPWNRIVEFEIQPHDDADGDDDPLELLFRGDADVAVTTAGLSAGQAKRYSTAKRKRKAAKQARRRNR